MCLEVVVCWVCFMVQKQESGKIFASLATSWWLESRKSVTLTAVFRVSENGIANVLPIMLHKRCQPSKQSSVYRKETVCSHSENTGTWMRMVYILQLVDRERFINLSSLFKSWFLSKSKALFPASILQLNRYVDMFTTTLKGKVKYNKDMILRVVCNVISLM